MKLIILSLTVFSVLLLQIAAEVSEDEQPQEEEQSEGICNFEGFELKEGESMPHPSQCSEVTCNSGPDDLTITGCAPTPANCEPRTEDNSKSYPECCGKLVCK